MSKYAVTIFDGDVWDSMKTQIIEADSARAAFQLHDLYDPLNWHAEVDCPDEVFEQLDNVTITDTSAYTLIRGFSITKIEYPTCRSCTNWEQDDDNPETGICQVLDYWASQPTHAEFGCSSHEYTLPDNFEYDENGIPQKKGE